MFDFSNPCNNIKLRELGYNLDSVDHWRREIWISKDGKDKIRITFKPTVEFLCNDYNSHRRTYSNEELQAVGEYLFKELEIL